MRVVGEPLTDFVIEASEDLLEWAELTEEQTDGDGHYEFTDTETDDFVRRFYRVLP